jgi:integrase
MLKAKHLNWRKGIPYIHCRYPSRLSETLTEMGRSTLYRKALDVGDNPSDAEVLAALEKARETFNALCDGLFSSNRRHLTEMQQHRAAQAFMSDVNLRQGDAKTEFAAYQIMAKSDAAAGLDTDIAERVEALLVADPDEEPDALLISDAIAIYKQQQTDLKYHRVLDRFLQQSGDRLLDGSINRRLHNWTQDQLKDRNPATITKDLSIILSCMRGAVKARGLSIMVHKPAIKLNEAKQRVILTNQQLEELFAQDMPEYLRCAFVAALTLGAINSEIYRIDPGTAGNVDGCLVVRIDDGKTKHRRRSGPLPWLARWVAPNVSEGRLRENMTARIKKVNQVASPYSLRHTFAHAHAIKHTPDVAQAQLAGWSSRARHSYGLGGVHYDELLRPLIPIQHSTWDWLLSPNPADNVVNLRGKA